MEDYQAVLESCKHCAMIGASTITTTGHVRYGEQAISDTWIRGLTPSMPQILDLDLTSGRMINENDEENRSQVCVIGTDIVDNFFPTVDPLGKEIRVEGEGSCCLGGEINENMNWFIPKRFNPSRTYQPVDF